jgi:hypothetical protein
MATEQDELRLTVALDDQASDQLHALQQQLQGLIVSGNAATSGLANFAQSLRATAGHAHQTHQSLHALFARGGFIGGFFLHIGEGVAEMAKGFVEATLDIKEFAEETVKLDNLARRAATSSAQFAANVASLRESGMGEDQAARLLTGFNDALADLQRPDSRILGEMLRGMQGQAREDVINLIQFAKEADREEAINAIKKAGENTRAYWEARGQPNRAAEAQASLYRLWHMPGLENFHGKLKTVSADYRRMIAERTEGARQYHESIAKQADAQDRLVKSIQAIAFEVLPINKGAELAGGVFEYMAKGALQLEDAFRNTNTEIQRQISEAQRSKVVTAGGREITAQEGVSEDELQKQRYQRRMVPRRTGRGLTGEPGAAPPGREQLPPNLSDMGDVGDVGDVTGGAGAASRVPAPPPPPPQPGGGARRTGGQRAGLLGGEVEAGEGAPGEPIPNIGDLLGASDKHAEPLDLEAIARRAPSGLSLGERMAQAGVPMSKNIIDLSQNKQETELAYLQEQEQHMRQLTTELATLNDYLAPEMMKILLAGTGAPSFHNAPQGGVEGESNPMQLPPGAAQPGGGAAAEARNFRTEQRGRIAGQNAGGQSIQDQARQALAEIRSSQGVSAPGTPLPQRRPPQASINVETAGPLAALGAQYVRDRVYSYDDPRITNERAKQSIEEKGEGLYGFAYPHLSKPEAYYQPGSGQEVSSMAHEFEHVGRAAVRTGAIAGKSLESNVFKRYEAYVEPSFAEAGGEKEERQQRYQEILTSRKLMETGAISTKEQMESLAEAMKYLRNAPPGELEEALRHSEAQQNYAKRMLPSRVWGQASGDYEAQPRPDLPVPDLPVPQGSLVTPRADRAALPVPGGGAPDEEPNLPQLAKYDAGRADRASGAAQDWIGEGYSRRGKREGELLSQSNEALPETQLAKYDASRAERASGNAQDWLGEGYSRRGRRGEDILSSLDSSILDRDADNIAVDQSGRLAVHVNAPNGTTVKAEGGGLFNKTETNRTVPLAQSQVA